MAADGWRCGYRIHGLWFMMIFMVTWSSHNRNPYALQDIYIYNGDIDPLSRIDDHPLIWENRHCFWHIGASSEVACFWQLLGFVYHIGEVVVMGKTLED